MIYIAIKSSEVTNQMINDSTSSNWAAVRKFEAPNEFGEITEWSLLKFEPSVVAANPYLKNYIHHDATSVQTVLEGRTTPPTDYKRLQAENAVEPGPESLIK